MKRLKELRGMLMECDPCVAVTIRKLVMVSLMEIFKDIAPTYRIRPLTPAEMAVKVTKHLFYTAQVMSPCSHLLIRWLDQIIVNGCF